MAAIVRAELREFVLADGSHRQQSLDRIGWAA
jgi:hypothetical protein